MTRLDALITFHTEWQHQVSSFVGKQSEYWSQKGKTDKLCFLRMAGHHLKRRALMRWSFSILNDNTKYLVRWVNNRNTEAKKARPKIMCFLRMAGNHLKRCALMRWLFSTLNGGTKYLVWWVNNRNTKAKKARPKSCFFKEWLESVRLAPWSPNFR